MLIAFAKPNQSQKYILYTIVYRWSITFWQPYDIIIILLSFTFSFKKKLQYKRWQVVINKINIFCRLRVQGTLANSRYFSKAYNCQKVIIIGMNSKYLSLKRSHYTVRNKDDFDSFIKTKNSILALFRTVKWLLYKVR